MSDIAEDMAATLYLRGPDSGGVWSDEAQGIALSHRRLAILDVSPAGHQPMASHDGRYVISFNGEIYNHLDIRTELQQDSPALVWRSTCDTETLIEAVSKWGIERTLRKLNGMFAFALWDIATQTLTLARDRAGEKPVYYGRFRNAFIFASEIKAIRSTPGWDGDIDIDALEFFVRYSYIPAPHSIFRGLQKLEAGMFMQVSARGTVISPPRSYGRTDEGGSPLPSLCTSACISELEKLLSDSIRRRMVADVPVGALFSGGIDSSTVVALMQSVSEKPIRTFTIGFEEKQFNEAEHAKGVAAMLGADHSELYVRPQDALDLIPELPSTWDEPFADPSQIPTFLISKFARQHVTVALSGDGGDELFCGYRHYPLGAQIFRVFDNVPIWARRSCAGAMSCASSFLRHVGTRFSRSSERLARLSAIVDFGDKITLCNSLESVYVDKEQLVTGSRAIENRLNFRVADDIKKVFMDIDLQRYLPENIMTKTDRASMANSLEVRAPLLDPRLVAFARHLPLELKFRRGEAKWILKQVLYRHLPKEVVDKPKTGFSVPIGEWLNGPLRCWAEELLSADSLRKAGYFDPDLVSRLWCEHKSGKRRRERVLWNILVFQAWLNNLPSPNLSSGRGLVR